MTVYIYAEKVERVDYNPDRRIVKAVKDGVPELSIRKTSTIALLDKDGNEFMSVSEGEEKEIKLTAGMIDGEVDFATVGEKKFTVTIDGEKIDLVVTVYDPAITNISDMWVEDSHIEIPMNTSKEDAAKMLVGKNLRIQYFEETDGKFEGVVQITEDMLDLTNFDASEAGMTFVELTYGGKTIKVPFNVTVDWSDAKLTSTLTGNIAVFALEGMAVTKIELYDNGFAKIYAVIEDNEACINESLGLGYTENGNVLTLTYLDNPLLSVKVNGEQFEANVSENVTEYEYEQGVTVKLYGNGSGVMEMGDMQVYFDYSVDDVEKGMLNIYPYEVESEGYLASFKIEGNKLVDVR